MVDVAQSDLYKNIPLGDNVAREFPWWRELEMDFASGAAYRQQRFVVGPQNAPLKSDRERPIKIHEIRFLINGTGTQGTNHSIAGPLWTSVQIFHSKYDIVSRWLPTQCLNTEEDRLILGDTFSGLYKLPAPYFVQRGQTFKLELTPIVAGLAERYVDVCLRGWDPENQTPCVMNKFVQLPTINNRVDVSFDEGRDAAIRSMWLHDIVIGYVTVDAASTPYSWNSGLRIRFHPGMGPLWTDEMTVGTIYAGLTHYDSGFNAGQQYRPLVIHRPVSPYVLNPRETLTIKMRNDLAMTYDNTWYCWVVGTQEGRY
ncbi:MAG: hypothetical protein ACYTBJ_00080 [Planctomycetota bacterium]|jgi:hypothetical protein